MADRPGVMLYLDLRPAISYLSCEDKGRLLDAILAYAADGTPLDDADGTLAAIWALLQPRIDRDAAAYESKCRKAAYAAYVRNCRHTQIDPDAYDRWYHRIAGDIGCGPNTDTYTTTTATTSTPTLTRADYDRYRRSNGADS